MKLTPQEQLLTIRKRLRWTQKQTAEHLRMSLQIYRFAESFGMISKKNESKFKTFIQKHLEENKNEKRKN